MQRAVIGLVGLALFCVQPLASQEARQPAHVYEAYYRISYADMDDWNRQYWEYSVPVLEQLREEGVIEGWAQWEHQSGSEYNVRFTARTYDWASLETFWNEYLSRLQAAMPADEWEAGSRMIVEHRDEIWDVDEARVPADAEVAVMYASTFRINFADMAEWNRMWDELAVPQLEQAMKDGILSGWVTFGHNTGGPHNWKVLYMFDSWDDIDDMFQTVLGSMAEQHPAEWARANELYQAHADAIWTPTRQEEM